PPETAGAVTARPARGSQPALRVVVAAICSFVLSVNFPGWRCEAIQKQTKQRHPIARSFRYLSHGVLGSAALITQRSLVQIQPPQPRRGPGRSNTSGALVFLYPAAPYSADIASRILMSGQSRTDAFDERTVENRRQCVSVLGACWPWAVPVFIGFLRRT